jgi:hypothetical protein
MTRWRVSILAGVAGILLVSAPAVAQNDGGRGGMIGGGRYTEQIIGGGADTASGAQGSSGGFGSGPTITNSQFSTRKAVGGSGGLSLGGQGGGSVGGGGSGGRRR